MLTAEVVTMDSIQNRVEYRSLSCSLHRSLEGGAVASTMQPKVRERATVNAATGSRMAGLRTLVTWVNRHSFDITQPTAANEMTHDYD
ncbi:MAG: hypothetical protein ABI748_05565 [Dokdonella sp.]